jgi:hypothetical protein
MIARFDILRFGYCRRPATIPKQRFVQYFALRIFVGGITLLHPSRAQILSAHMVHHYPGDANHGDHTYQKTPRR